MVGSNAGGEEGAGVSSRRSGVSGQIRWLRIGLDIFVRSVGLIGFQKLRTKLGSFVRRGVVLELAVLWL